MTDEEIANDMKEINSLAKNKKIQNQFDIMFLEYVEIAKRVLKCYRVKNIPTVMKNTYLRPFKTYDKKNVVKKDVLIGGLHQHFFRKQTFHRISLNPYSDNKDYSLQYLGNADPKDLEKLQSQDLEKADLLKAGKTSKLVDNVDAKLFAEGVRSLENGLPPAKEERWGKEHSPKITLTHEMLHSFAKLEFYEKTERNPSSFSSIKFRKDGKIVELAKVMGGTQNIDLHEGMTEFLTRGMIYRNNDFYDYGSIDIYHPSYSQYVAYVDNVSIIFPGVVPDIYFNGVNKINDYKNEFTSLKELFSDFEIMDTALNNIKEKAQESHSLTKDDLKDFETVQTIYQKQLKLFDTLLEKKIITKEAFDNLKSNLFCFVSESVYGEKCNKIKITKNSDETLKIESNLDLKYVLKIKKNIKEEDIVKGKPLSDLFKTTETAYCGLKLLGLTKIKSPTEMTLASFFVTKEKDFSLLPIKDEKRFDKKMFCDVVILEDGKLGFTQNFADLKLNGYNTDGAIKISINDGVLSVVPNLFYDEDFKEKTIFDVCQREKVCMPDFETEFCATAAQTVGFLNTLKVLGLDLMDCNIAPNIKLDESVMEKYFILDEKNKLEQKKEKIEKKGLMQKVFEKSERQKTKERNF